MPGPAPAASGPSHLVPRTPQARSLPPPARAGARAQCAATGPAGQGSLPARGRRYLPCQRYAPA
eukprot:scaffold14517_cov48-Phaeocystis_antarctica.AAC.1